MATKLRSFSRNIATKVAAMILFAICITTSVAQIQYTSYQDHDLESLFVKQYKDSSQFRDKMNEAFYNIENIITSKTKTADEVKYYYIVEIGKTNFTNVPSLNLAELGKYDKAFFLYQNHLLTSGKNTNAKYLTSYNRYRVEELAQQSKEQIRFSFAYPDSFLQEGQQAWDKDRKALQPVAFNVVGNLILSILLVIYLILTAGRRKEDTAVHLSRVDSVYSDVMLGAFILVTLCWFALLNQDYSRSSDSGVLSAEQILSVVVNGVTTAVYCMLGGTMILSLVRKIKARRLIKHSLCYSVCFFVYDLARSLFDGRRFAKYPLTRSLFYRQAIFIGSSAAATFFFLILVAGRNSIAVTMPILEIALIYWFLKGSNQTFDEINKGFNASLEEQMKAERMKIALVTNVSHDLKTPLTSIISYVELLSKEESLSEECRDYVRILEEKSERLKAIVSDLFDLARSTSGNIALELETLDLKKLVEQTLADMDDRIHESGLLFKVKLTEDSVAIRADGKRLYRVFQNLIDNALKYSLAGTRVFVELNMLDERAIVTVKNTAGYEMDFTAYEILQRFSRGDKARSTEGTGLGLSIAESFTEICGGNFKVDVDGDLFKVTLAFPLVKAIL